MTYGDFYKIQKKNIAFPFWFTFKSYGPEFSFKHPRRFRSPKEAELWLREYINKPPLEKQLLCKVLNIKDMKNNESVGDQ
jgi:hypothetical protein